MKKSKLILSGIVGNAIEVYDLLIYQYFAKYITASFIPHDLQSSGMIIQLIFFLGFLARPLGAVLFGAYSDIQGRKKSLELSIILSGLSTSCIALIPDYSDIGVFSIIFLVLFRILQGISIGGEYAPSLSLLIEHAKPNKIGTIGCWAGFGLNLGMLIGSIVATGFEYLSTTFNLPSYSWRLIFLLSAFLSLFGLWIRRNLAETLEFIVNNSCEMEGKFLKLLKESSVFTISKSKIWFSVIILTLLGTLTTYTIFVCAPTLLVSIHHFSRNQMFLINSMSLLGLLIFIPYFGKLSDTIGRKPILIYSALAIFILCIISLFSLKFNLIFQTLVIHLLFCLPAAAYFAVTPILIIEILPPMIRCTAHSFLYSIPASVFAGLSPLLINILSHDSNSFSSAIMFLLLCTILVAIPMYLLKEPTDAYKNINDFSLQNLKV